MAGAASLPERLPPFGAGTELPWLPKPLQRYDWTCDRHEVTAMEVVAATLWSKLRAGGMASSDFEYTLPGRGVVVRPGDIVHYDRFASGLVAHRAVHVGMGFIVHVWRTTAKCSCGSMSPPGTHGGPGTRARIELSRMNEYPYVSQAWHLSSVKDDAPPREERVYRALASIGSINYNLLYANCDHFVDAVIDPTPSSRARPSRIVVFSTVLVFAAVVLFLALMTTAALHTPQQTIPRAPRTLEPRAAPTRQRPSGRPQ